LRISIVDEGSEGLKVELEEGAYKPPICYREKKTALKDFLLKNVPHTCLVPIGF
jgi:hypothetical protein